MLIYKTSKELINFLAQHKSKNKTVGFIPTMGALHQGHISLVNQSKNENDISICSIFVNPSQFNQKEDFDKYPITTNNDILMLSAISCDILFLPSVDDIYPAGWNSETKIDLGEITKLWEGFYRPGHFDGVIQVVNLLLEITQPNILYLGQKDYQQCAVIKKLIAYKQLPIKTEICNTIREVDGLALSSRNTRLSKTERIEALILSQSLFFIKSHFLEFNNEELISRAKSFFDNQNNIKLEYLVIVDRESLQELISSKNNAVALIVAWVGNVRLIDNMLLD